MAAIWTSKQPWTRRPSGVIAPAMGSGQLRNLLWWAAGMPGMYGFRRVWPMPGELTAVGVPGAQPWPDGGWSHQTASSAYLTDIVVDMPAQWSIAMWVRYLGNVAIVRTSRNSTNGTYAGASIQLSTTSAVQYGDNTGSGRRIGTVSTTPATGGIYHLVGVCRGATDMSLYINGAAQSLSYSGSGGAIVTGAVGLALAMSYAGAALDIGFADLRCYGAALTQAEAQALYAPRTRWELYAPTGARTYIDMTGSASAFHPAWTRCANVLVSA